MGNISLLDCTLRDGGYLNDWRFGNRAIKTMISKLGDTGVEILEVGFLKKEAYQPDRTVFSREEQMEEVVQTKRPGVLYAGMVEVMNPLPLEDLVPRAESTIDIVRVIVWKRLLKEGFEYCRAIAEKGYKVCIQPARVNQYSESEFVEMIHLFNSMKPMALYVVDSWGTQTREQVLRYLELADRHLDAGISLGYHGHNNMQQAFSCAESFASAGLVRDIIIDASVFGIGRGAGNLNVELFAWYLNQRFQKSYRLGPMLEVYTEFIEPVFRATPWGYSVPHFLTALFDCNPEYAQYFGQEMSLPALKISEMLASMSDSDRIMFSPEKANKYI